MIPSQLSPVLAKFRTHWSLAPRKNWSKLNITWRVNLSGNQRVQFHARGGHEFGHRLRTAWI
jgi:hypothetical protein